jgi:hypothetical protein
LEFTQRGIFKNSSLSDYVSSVKPRFSYGVNGNVAGIGNYEVQGVYGSQGNYNTNLGFLSTSIINTGLRWEKSTTLDVGVDLGLLKNRISLMVDYYDRRTSDLLTNLTYQVIQDTAQYVPIWELSKIQV